MSADISELLFKTGLSLAVWWWFWVWVTSWRADDKRRCDECGAVLE